jgi:hypothetical protein
MRRNRADLLEQLIQQDLDRMLAVKNRAVQQEIFQNLCTHVRQRSPQQVRKMEQARGFR